MYVRLQQKQRLGLRYIRRTAYEPKLSLN